MDFLTHGSFVFSGCLGALAEDDGDVAHTFLNSRGAAHGSRTPAAHEFVRRLVDKCGLHEERVEVDPGALRARVGNGTLDDLLQDGRARFPGELQELKGLPGRTAADEIDDNTGLTRTEPREASD